MSSLELQVYDIFKTKLGEKEAAVIIEYFEAKTDKKYEEKKDILATKQDLSSLENRLIKQIYWGNIVQFLATVGAIIAIIKFMMH